MFRILFIACFLAGCATTSPSTNPAPVTYTAAQTFPIQAGQSWTMRDQLGNDTYFQVNSMPDYQACQQGTFLDLYMTKSATAAYWAPGTPGASVHFILKNEQGTWRGVSEVAGASPAQAWMAAIETVQKNPIEGLPTPYVLLPASIAEGQAIEQKTQYTALSVWGKDLSACVMPLDVNNPPGTFGGVEDWHTIFSVSTVQTPVYSGPAVESDFLGDNHEEKWYFAPGIGLVGIDDGGIILTRIAH